MARRARRKHPPTTGTAVKHCLSGPELPFDHALSLLLKLHKNRLVADIPCE
jgi:hypothetical protein